jgi:hypothetical protein
MILIIVALCVTAAPAADAAPAPRSVGLSMPMNYYPAGTQGSDWWYSIHWDSTGAHTAITARMSWSYMWTLNNSSDLATITQAGSALCAAVLWEAPPAIAGCVALVQIQYWYFRHEVYMGTHVYRQCLYYRFAAPPLWGPSSYAIYLDTCRV